MSLAAAQERYDNQLPDYEPDHSFTGDVVIADDNGDDILFTFEDGYIATVSIDENGTTIPYSQWHGCEKLVAKAEEEASVSYFSSQEERSYYDY
jgi:hypothetical protein